MRSSRFVLQLLLALMLFSPCISRAQDPVYGYEFNRFSSQFLTIQNEQMQAFLAGMNEGSGKKAYALLVPLNPLEAYTIAGDNLAIPVKMPAITTNQRKSHAQELTRMFINNMIPEAERSTAIVYVLGYYTSKDKTNPNAKDRLNVIHDLVGFSSATTVGYLRTMAHNLGYKNGGLKGLDTLLTKRMQRLDGLMKGNIAVIADKPKMTYIINDDQLLGIDEIVNRITESNAPPAAVPDMTAPGNVMVDLSNGLTDMMKADLRETVDRFNRDAGEALSLIVTGFKTAGNLMAYAKKASELPSVIWMHFNSDKSLGVEMKNFIMRGGDQFLCEGQGEDQLPHWLAEIKVKYNVPGLFAEYIKYFSEMKTTIGSVEIPMKYIDPDDAAYVHYSDALIGYILGYDEKKFAELSEAQRNTDKNDVLSWKYNPGRRAFAFYAGASNSFVNLAGSVPRLVSTLGELRCNRFKRMLFLMALEKFWSSPEGEPGLWENLKKKLKEKFGTMPNPVMLEYYKGYVAATILTSIVSSARAGTMGDIGNVLVALNAATYTTRPAMQLAGFALQLALKGALEGGKLALQGLYKLGGGAQSIIMRLSGEPGARFIEGLNMTIGGFMNIARNWRELEKVKFFARELGQKGDQSFVYVRSPMIDKMMELYKAGRTVTIVNHAGKTYEVTDAIVQQASGVSGLVTNLSDDVTPVVPPGASLAIVAIPKEVSTGLKLYGVEVAGKIVEVAIRGTGETLMASGSGGGTGGNGNGGNGGDGGDDDDDDYDDGKIPRPAPGSERMVKVRNGEVVLGNKQNEIVFDIMVGDEFICNLHRTFEASQNQLVYRVIDVNNSFLYSADVNGPSSVFSGSWNLAKASTIKELEGRNLPPDNWYLSGILDVPAGFKARFKGLGAIMYEDTRRFFGERIDGIIGTWVDMAAYRDNLDLYRAARRAGLLPEQAAFQTKTGTYAMESGYTEAEMLKDVPEEVMVLFKPGPERQIENGSTAPIPPGGTIALHLYPESEQKIGRTMESAQTFWLEADDDKEFYIDRLLDENGEQHQLTYGFHDSRDRVLDRNEFIPMIQVLKGNDVENISLPQDMHVLKLWQIDRPVALHNYSGAEAVMLDDSYKAISALLERSGRSPIEAIVIPYSSVYANKTIYQALQQHSSPGMALYNTPVAIWARVNGFIHVFNYPISAREGVVVIYKEVPEGRPGQGSQNTPSYPSGPSVYMQADREKWLTDFDYEDNMAIYQGNRHVLNVKRNAQFGSVRTISYSFEGKVLNRTYSAGVFTQVTVDEIAGETSYTIEVHFNLPEEVMYPGLEEMVLDDIARFYNQIKSDQDWQAYGMTIECHLAPKNLNLSTLEAYRKARRTRSDADAAFETPVGKMAREIDFAYVVVRERNPLTDAEGSPELQMLFIKELTDEELESNLPEALKDSELQQRTLLRTNAKFVTQNTRSNGTRVIKLNDMSGNRLGEITRNEYPGKPGERGFANGQVVKQIKYKFRESGPKSRMVRLDFTLQRLAVPGGQEKLVIYGPIDIIPNTSPESIAAIMREVIAADFMAHGVQGVIATWTAGGAFPMSRENAAIFFEHLQKNFIADAAAQITPTAKYWIGKGYAWIEVRKDGLEHYPVYYIIFWKGGGNLPN